MWSQQEDALLLQIVQSSEQKRWMNISKQLSELGGTFKRTSRQCRDRWMNYLDPTIKTENWTEQEEELLFQYHAIYGNKWSIIAKKLAGRPQNFVKNHFYSAFRKGLRKLNRFIETQFQRSQARLISDHFLTRVLVLAHDAKAFRSSHVNIHEKCIVIKSELIRYSKNIPIQGEEKQKMKRLVHLIIQVNKVYRNRKRPRKNKKPQASLSQNLQENSDIESEVDIKAENLLEDKESEYKQLNPPQQTMQVPPIWEDTPALVDPNGMFHPNNQQPLAQSFQNPVFGVHPPYEQQQMGVYYYWNNPFNPWVFNNFMN